MTVLDNVREQQSMTERKDNKLWGGRFERAPDARFDAFQRSFAFDRRLLEYEIAVDRAWAKALEPSGIFSATEGAQTLAALDKIANRAQSDPAWMESFGADAEDVHHFVEKALVEELGAVGWKLHTGRSRNELVATDFRLFVIDAAAEMQRGLEALLNAFLVQAKANLSVPMAGMTHMQHAQPILLSHFLLAHAEAFTRDITRLQNAAASADACPMGSGALAGNSFAINREAIARELGFSKITANSLDAVSDRDFALDYNSALLATEAADYLVRKGVPFRQAHDLVGKLLREAEKQSKNWIELPLAELQKISSEIGSDFAKSLTVEAALAAKKVSGGTS